MEWDARRTLGVTAITELVLLVVCAAECPESKKLDSHDDGDVDGAELDGAESEVARLKAVGEGHPDEITKGQHEAEAVGGDVHLVEN